MEVAIGHLRMPGNPQMSTTALPPYERSVTLQRAEHLIDTCLTDNGITCSTIRHGSRLSSTVATLHGVDPGRGDPIGCGKGHPDEARVGAKFEAYEHLMGPPMLRAMTHAAGRQGVLAQPQLEGLLPLRSLGQDAAGASRTGAGRIGVIPFDGDAGNALAFPAFLIDHTYAGYPLDEDDSSYLHARRYACGTGLAAGVGRSEAEIHAIGETIERHAVGRFIADHYFHRQVRPIRRIASRTLLPTLSALLDEAEEEIGAGIELLDARSTIDCPVYIARCPQRALAGIHVLGAGASLHPHLAAERAIKELVQQYRVADGEPQVLRDWQRSSDRLRRWPRLHRCMTLRPDEAVAVDVAYDRQAGPATRLPLDAHLHALKQRCAAAGLPVWTRLLDHHRSGVSLACAVMPRMERFSIVALGGRVVPCW